MKISDILAELANNWRFYSVMEHGDPDLIAMEIIAKRERDRERETKEDQ